MLFEILLVVGITFVALGLLFVLGSVMFEFEPVTMRVGLIVAIFGMILIGLAVLLPPIPIIPQG